MPDSAQNRRFIRYSFEESPILFEIPDLAPVMIEPVNISWGGFEIPEQEASTLGAKLSMAGAFQRPVPGTALTCAIEVASQVIPGCAAQIPWALPPRQDAPGWTLGVAVTIPESELGRFREAMREVRVHLRPEEMRQAG